MRALSASEWTCQVTSSHQQQLKVLCSKPRRTWQPSPAVLNAAVNGGSGGGCQEGLNRQLAGLSIQVLATQDHPDPLLLEPHSNKDTAVDGSIISGSSLTRLIVQVETVEELHHLLHYNVQCLNYIHVSAALVKLARLTGGQVWPVQTSNSSVAQAEASLNGWHDQTTVLRSPRVHRRSNRHSSQRQYGPEQHDMAKWIANDLCNRFIVHIPEYTLARQLANVCWALGTLYDTIQFQPNDALIQAIEQALMDSRRKLLSTAKPQEMSNLTWGLAKLGRPQSVILPAAFDIAVTELHSFQPQELSNLAWAAAKAHISHKRQHPPRTPTPASHKWSLQTASQQQEFVDAGHNLSSCVAEVAIAAGRRLQHFKPFELVSLLWSCSVTSISHMYAVPLYAAALPLLKHYAQTGKLSCQDAGNAAWAYAKMQLGSLGHQLLDILSPMLLSPLPTSHQSRWQPQAYQHHSQQQQQQEADSQHTHQKHHSSRSQQSLFLHCCNNQELCNILWACASQKYRRPQDQLASAILTELRSRQHQLCPRGLATASLAAAHLDLQHVQARCELVHALAHFIGSQDDKNPLQHAANTLWAASSLPGSVLTDAAMRQSISRLVQMVHSHIDALPPTALAQLAWAAGQIAPACYSNAEGTEQQSSAQEAGMQKGTVKGSKHRHRSKPDVDGQLSQMQLYEKQGPVAQRQHIMEPTQQQEIDDMSVIVQDREIESSGGWQQGSSAVQLNEQLVLDSPALHRSQEGPQEWYNRTWQPLLYSINATSSKKLDLFSAQDLSILAQGLADAQKRYVNRQLFERVGDRSLLLLETGAFTAGGLAGLLAAFVKAGIAHRQLAQAAAGDASRRLAQYQPTELANLMWALACMRIQHRPLLDNACRMLLAGPLAHVPSVVQPTQSAAASNTQLNGQQQPSTSQQQQYAPVHPNNGSQALFHNNSNMDPNHISQPTSQADTQGESINSSITAVDSDNTQDAQSNLNSGQADSWYAPPPVMGHGASHAVLSHGHVPDEDDDDDNYGPRSSSTLLLRQLGWDDNDDSDGGGNAPQPRSRAMQETDMNELPWIQSVKPGRMPPPSDASTLSVLGTEPPRCNPAMVWTVLAWAFARSGYHQHQLFNRLAAAVLTSSQDSVGSTPQNPVGKHHSHGNSNTDQVHAQHPSLGQQGLAGLRTASLVQLIWSYAVLDHSHPGLLQATAPVLAARILKGKLNTREVATVAWVYAKLQHYEPVLFRAILQEAMTNANRYGMQDWSRLAWAFSTLSLPSEEAFFVRLNQLQRQQNPAGPAAAQQLIQPTAGDVVTTKLRKQRAKTNKARARRTTK